MSALKVQAICPKCKCMCGIKREKGNPSPLLAQHTRPGEPSYWHSTRCDATGADATAGIAAWIERERRYAELTVRLETERLETAAEAHARELAAIRKRGDDARALIVALAKSAAKLAKATDGGAK